MPPRVSLQLPTCMPHAVHPHFLLVLHHPGALARGARLAACAAAAGCRQAGSGLGGGQAEGGVGGCMGWHAPKPCAQRASVRRCGSPAHQNVQCVWPRTARRLAAFMSRVLPSMLRLPREVALSPRGASTARSTWASDLQRGGRGGQGGQPRRRLAGRARRWHVRRAGRRRAAPPRKRPLHPSSPHLLLIRLALDVLRCCCSRGVERWPQGVAQPGAPGSWAWPAGPAAAAAAGWPRQGASEHRRKCRHGAESRVGGLRWEEELVHASVGAQSSGIAHQLHWGACRPGLLPERCMCMGNRVLGCRVSAAPGGCQPGIGSPSGSDALA